MAMRNSATHLRVNVINILLTLYNTAKNENTLTHIVTSHTINHFFCL